MTYGSASGERLAAIMSLRGLTGAAACHARVSGFWRAFAVVSAGLVWLMLQSGVGAAQEAAGGGVLPPGAPETAKEERSAPWAIVCQALGPGRTACGLLQRQVLEGGGVLLTLEISGLEAGRDGSASEPVLTLTTPLGTRLRDGLLLTVDGAELARLSFDMCLQVGCVAQLAGEAMLDRLRAGAELAVRFGIDTGGGAVEELTLSAPLTGISRGVDVVRGRG